MTSAMSGRYLAIQRHVWQLLDSSAPSLQDTIKTNIILGFTSFGGPAAHFQILRQLFVEKKKWIGQPMFEELFGIVQVLSGPASTKMLYCINLHHSGTTLAILAFFLWSLPGALAAFGLAHGVSNIGEVLPAPVYALLSGINAATVGIVVLAAVQLSRKVVTDRFTRAILFLEACAGMLYNALWYLPVLMVAAGAATYVWDSGVPLRIYQRIKVTVRLHNQSANASTSQIYAERIECGDLRIDTTASDVNDAARVIPLERRPTTVSCKEGCIVAATFLTSFVIVIVLSRTLHERSFLFDLFSKFYLAGTIIFGGGPVVIPLLRDYIVTEGWVSSRDFLLGLALIQAFPGPNFNFAVFLGTLAAINASLSSVAGAVMGFIGIFAPGLLLVHAIMGIWTQIRSRRWIKSILRGVNAAAVGFIFSAVYRLWRIGFIDGENASGTSLDRDPWWVVIAATSYVGGEWFCIPVPVAIVLGGVMGLIWYGVTS